MSENHDKDIPRSSEYVGGPVTERNFDGKPNVHIFWGPGQFTLSYPGYDAPTPEYWRHGEHLQIPQVVRFIHSADKDQQSDKYDDAGSGDPDPDPDPMHCTYKYELYYQTIGFSVKAAYRDPNPPIGVEYTYDYNGIKDIGGSQNYAGPWDRRFDSVQVYDQDHNLIYSGTWMDAPYFRKGTSRSIKWTRLCTGGGIPAPGNEQILPTWGSLSFSIASNSSTGIDPNQKPRCWAPLIRYDAGLDATVEAPEFGYVSEVPNDGFGHEFYGCGAEPGDPPVHEPPPNELRPPPPPPGP